MINYVNNGARFLRLSSVGCCRCVPNAMTSFFSLTQDASLTSLQFYCNNHACCSTFLHFHLSFKPLVSEKEEEEKKCGTFLSEYSDTSHCKEILQSSETCDSFRFLYSCVYIYIFTSSNLAETEPLAVNFHSGLYKEFLYSFPQLELSFQDVFSVLPYTSLTLRPWA